MKNRKGFTLVELLATIAVLAIVISITMYIAINAIKRAKENTYQVTLNNVVDNTNSYLLEDKDLFFMPSADGTYEYQCVTVQNLIDKGYLRNDVTKSKVAEDRLVLTTDNIYIERNTATKAIVKNEYVIDSNSAYANVCSVMATVTGTITFNANPSINEWSRAKDVAIRYGLKNIANRNDFQKYSYDYTFDVVDSSTFTTAINGNRCWHNHSTNTYKIIYVKACQKYDLYGNATLCTTKQDGNVLVSELRDASNNSCVGSGNDSSNIFDNRVASNDATVNANGTIYANIKRGEQTVIANSFYVSKIDRIGPVITVKSSPTGNINNDVTIVLNVSDTQSGVNNASFSKEDLVIKAGDTIIPVNQYTLTYKSNNDYELKISNNSEYIGKLEIEIDENKVFDNVENGNEATTLKPNITFIRTYTIHYQQGKGNSGESLVQLGTSTCNFGTACTLKTYASLDGIFPYSEAANAANGETNYSWVFAGWSTSATSATISYTNGATYNPSTYKTDVYLYAVGKKEFQFFGGTDSKLLSTPVQYWNPYSTSTTYMTSITIPNKIDIDTWTFCGYRGGTSTASEGVCNSPTYAPSLAGKTVTPTYDTWPSTRSVYNRTLKISYNANGGSGTMSDTTLNQYFNTGWATSNAAISSNSITLASNGFTKSGNNFNGWAEGSASGTKYNAGASYSGIGTSVTDKNVSKTMYATWQAVSGGGTSQGGGCAYTITTNICVSGTAHGCSPIGTYTSNCTGGTYYYTNNNCTKSGQVMSSTNCKNATCKVTSINCTKGNCYQYAPSIGSTSTAVDHYTDIKYCP